MSATLTSPVSKEISYQGYSEAWILKNIRFVDYQKAEDIYWHNVDADYRSFRQIRLMILRCFHSYISEELAVHSYELDQSVLGVNQFSESWIGAYLKIKNLPTENGNHLLESILTRTKRISRYIIPSIQSFFTQASRSFEISRYSEATQKSILSLHPELKDVWHFYPHQKLVNLFNTSVITNNLPYSVSLLIRNQSLPFDWEARLNDYKFHDSVETILNSSIFVASRMSNKLPTYGEITYLYAYLISKHLPSRSKLYYRDDVDILGAHAYEVVKERYPFFDFDEIDKMFLISFLPSLDDSELFESVFPKEKHLSFS